MEEPTGEVHPIGHLADGVSLPRATFLRGELQAWGNEVVAPINETCLEASGHIRRRLTAVVPELEFMTQEGIVMLDRKAWSRLAVQTATRGWCSQQAKGRLTATEALRGGRPPGPYLAVWG